MALGNLGEGMNSLLSIEKTLAHPPACTCFRMPVRSILLCYCCFLLPRGWWCSQLLSIFPKRESVVPGATESMGSTVDDQIMVAITCHMTATANLHCTELLTGVLCPQHSVKVVYLRGHPWEEGQAQRGEGGGGRRCHRLHFR